MSNFVISDRFYFSSETLSLINKYFGSTFVIKYGGSAMQNPNLQSQVIEDLSLLHFLGINIVLVHGGGIFINNWLNRLNIEPKFENGVRITDPEAMEIVEMVLVGKINKELVSLFNQNNICSIGLSGKDANLIHASAMFKSTSNLTGKVKSINSKVLHLLFSNRFIPVIASIASDLKGKTYNINADTVASSIASELKADKLILLTDMPGILRDVHDSSTLIKDISLDSLTNLLAEDVISGGMIPKIQSCIDALRSNVKSVHIIDGRLEHSILHELLTYNRVGSMIVS
uniref:Acetylglutamate kinase n=1 Tax=Alsidium seaforthii TaxID=2007182 RepID=A0A1Z1MDM0_9FLOR|nr:acetylglutamate kinase [Bryothamnion seaforthii]ARW64019.1 acetylglutamate kinase [Bryothamnion seaforthii]